MMRVKFELVAREMSKLDDSPLAVRVSQEIGPFTFDGHINDLEPMVTSLTTKLCDLLADSGMVKPE